MSNNEKTIDLFRDENYFLSNMFPCKITYQGISYNSSEALFQSLKLKNVKEREHFSNIDGYTSKKLGKRVKLREDWEEYKIKAMKIALYSKFTQNKELAIKLINTNDLKLEEGNKHGDVFWGTVNGRGENNLGKLLMELREVLKRDVDRRKEGMDDRIERCKQLDLKSVIEAYGGEFKKGMFSVPGAWGYEQSPSGKVYMKGGNQYFHHHKTGKHGDAIQFVQDVMGVDKSKAINMLLGEEKAEVKRNISPIDKAELQARELREKKEKAKRESSLLYAISKNSKPLIDSNLACEYMMNRGISTAALTLRDPRIAIYENTFKNKDGEEQSRIIYMFKGNGKNSQQFAVIKGIDDHGNKNGFKQCLGSSRPVFHQSKVKAPYIITEGIEDALSAKEMGYDNFVSLNSTSNTKKLIDTLDQCPKFYKNNTFEICLDNDEAGRKATEDILKAFKERGIEIKESEYSGIMKELNINDLNDLLIKEYIDPVDRLMDWS